jgi:FkbM family methyltransferase
VNINKLIFKIRFKVNQYFNENAFLTDITTRLKHTKQPIIFDVGGNVGQSIKLFRKRMPHAIIHSFEPQRSSYNVMCRKFGSDDKTVLINNAVGSVVGSAEFNENAQSVMSSILKLGKDGWGTIISRSNVDVITVDEYCRQNKIDHIDVLKSDTQGYDFEVFKGAENMIRNNKIKMIYFEFILSDMYENRPSFTSIFQYLIDNNFRLVNIYDLQEKNGFASWGDALFLNCNYKK